MKKLYFNKEIQTRMDTILEPFRREEEWRALEIPNQELPSAAILLSGRPGTGKTELAFHILQGVSGLNRREIPQLKMGDLASCKLGETERAISLIFKDAYALVKRRNRPARRPVVFMDEVESIAWNRARVTDDSIHVLSIVDMLLLSIDRLLEDGGMVIAATNFPEYLDAALVRRMTDKIELTPPRGKEALAVWKVLMPAEPFGFSLSSKSFSPPVDWTPNEIQKWILSEARKAFIEKRNMQWNPNL